MKRMKPCIDKDRSQDRSKKDDCGSCFHKTSSDEEEDIDNQHQEVRVVCNGKEKRGYLFRNLLGCEEPESDIGSPDDKHDDGTGNRAVNQDSWYVFHLQRFKDKEAKDESEEDGNGRCLGCRKNTGHDPPENDDRED